jgi:hypothetical protein
VAVASLVLPVAVASLVLPAAVASLLEELESEGPAMWSATPKATPPAAPEIAPFLMVEPMPLVGAAAAAGAGSGAPTGGFSLAGAAGAAGAAAGFFVGKWILILQVRRIKTSQDDPFAYLLSTPLSEPNSAPAGAGTGAARAGAAAERMRRDAIAEVERILNVIDLEKWSVSRLKGSGNQVEEGSMRALGRNG